MAVWQAIYPCRLMPFPSGVLPTNRNMPWNSNWKIHPFPPACFLAVEDPQSSIWIWVGEGFSLLYPLRREPAARWISANASEWCLPFISISSSLFLVSVFIFLPPLPLPLLGLFWAAEKDIFEIVHGNVRFWGSLICRWNDCITQARCQPWIRWASRLIYMFLRVT